MVHSWLESLSLEFEGPWPGVISWLHSVRIGSSTTSKTTHCSVTSPLTLGASSQEAEGRLLSNPILQPFRYHIRVFSITDNLVYWLQRSSGSRRVGTTGRRNVLSIGEWNGRPERRRNRNQTMLSRRGFSVFNWTHFNGRSMELRRRTPCIRRRLWRTHSRDRRALAVCTPTQPPQHLLLSDRQLTHPIFVFLKTHPQQDALFPLPVDILPMTIHPFLVLSVHSGDLILQVVYNGLQLFDLPLQSCHLHIIVVVLDKGLVSYSSKEYASRPPTCAMFPSINLTHLSHSHLSMNCPGVITTADGVEDSFVPSVCCSIPDTWCRKDLIQTGYISHYTCSHSPLGFPPRPFHSSTFVGLQPYPFISLSRRQSLDRSRYCQGHSVRPT